MPTSRLLEKIHKRIQQNDEASHRVEAIRFFHESAIVPLKEAKEYVEALQTGQAIEIHAGNREYLESMEKQDGIGAAASLCFHFGKSPTEAIAATLRSAQHLEIEAHDLEAFQGSTPSSSARVESIVLERAIAIAREKAILNLMQRSGTTRDVAEQIFDKFSSPDASSPPSMETGAQQGQQALHGFQPINEFQSSNPQTLAASPSHAVLSQTSAISKYLAISARLVALFYGLVAVAGLIFLNYSFQASPRQFERLSLAERTSDEEQRTILQSWASENIPSTLTWFFRIDRYIDQRLEPGLPSDYSFLDTDWDKKLNRFNQSATEAFLAYHRCQQMVLVFYVTALFLAAWYGYHPNPIAALSMGFLGALGLAPMLSSSFQWDLQNGMWLLPLLIPGSMAIGISFADTLLIPTQSTRRLHARGLWIGIIGLVITSSVLAWAILSHGHLRTNAGVGVFASVLLILHHAWHYVRSYKGSATSLK